MLEMIQTYFGIFLGLLGITVTLVIFEVGRRRDYRSLTRTLQDLISSGVVARNQIEGVTEKASQTLKKSSTTLAVVEDLSSKLQINKTIKEEFRSNSDHLILAKKIESQHNALTSMISDLGRTMSDHQRDVANVKKGLITQTKRLLTQLKKEIALEISKNSDPKLYGTLLSEHIDKKISIVDSPQNYPLAIFGEANDDPNMSNMNKLLINISSLNGTITQNLIEFKHVIESIESTGIPPIPRERPQAPNSVEN